MAEMKEAIKAVSIDLFAHKGYFATSMSDIAKGCGIQKASIYYYYNNKETLLYHILDSTMTDLTHHLKSNLIGIENIVDRLRIAIRSHVEFHLERQQENFIANSELRGLSSEHRTAIVARRDEYERIFQSLIDKGIQSGDFAPSDIKILSYAILALCTAGATWYKPEGRLTIQQIASIYETFILKGLKNGLFNSSSPQTWHPAI